MAKPTGVHIVRLGDQSWTFDENEITLRDAFAIKATSGLSMKPFIAGIDEMDPLALQTLVWFCKFKAGDSTERALVDFKLADLALEDVPAGPPAVADPAATNSGTDETTTSEPSPTSAT